MIFIKEFLPNPVGPDTGKEHITLQNDGTEPASLSGWSLKDASGKTFKLTGQSIPAGGELELSSTLTKITLNNNGETISLFDSAGKLVDSLDYSGTAIEGQPVTHMQNLTAEVRAKLFDDYADKVLPANNFGLDAQFFIVMFAVAGLLAGASAFVYKNVISNEYKPQNSDNQKQEPTF